MTPVTAPAPAGTADAALQAKPRAFTRAHLVTLLVVWYPLSPLVVAWLWAKFAEVFLHGTLHVGLPTPVMALFALTVTILGPFTALIEGRNRLDCWRFAMEALPVCGGAILLGLLVQVFWRPTGAWGRGIRLALFGAGVFVWLGGALFSVLRNSG